MDDGQHRHSDQLHDPVQTNQDMMIRIVIMIMVIKILIMMMTIGNWYCEDDKEPKAGSEDVPAVLSRPPEKPPLSKFDLFL